MRNNFRNKGISLILALVLCLTAVLIVPPQEVEAATIYINVETFAKGLAEKLKLKKVQGEQASGFVNVLLEKGIIKEGDFTSYTEYITRGDAAVLLNRADEYLYGDTLNPKLVETALEKRISDINKIAKDKRTDVVKCYLKGYITGYSNGTYTTDREFRGSQRISRAGALKCFKMLTDKSLRYPISPDGQLIRTTKLPKYAKYYPYVLASFPNSYYDWKFIFTDAYRYAEDETTGKTIKVPYKNIIDYVAPVDIDKATRMNNFVKVKEEYLDTWVETARTHMEGVFNVDYRTIGDEWVERMMTTSPYYGYRFAEASSRESLKDYVKEMKKNKTIIESSKIITDNSSFYYFNGAYYLRFFVKYRIVSSNTKYGDSTAKKMDKPYSNILYTKFPVIDFYNGFTIGEWRECCFEIELIAYDASAPEKLGVSYTYLTEHWYTDRKVK